MPYHLYVFGSNGEGQLGIPAADIVQTPTRAPSWPPEESIKAVCGGDNHTLIHSTQNIMYHAGDNRKQQLGIRRTDDTRIERFEQLDKFSFCAATCESSAYILNGLGDTNDSTLMTAGTSHWGELGHGSSASTVQVSEDILEQKLPYSVIDFAAGGWHYVAILSNGNVWGWGKSRLDQLGPKLSAQQRVTKPTLLEENIPFQPFKVVCGKEFTYLASEPSLGQHYLLGRDKFSLRASMPPHIKGWKQIGATWNAIFILFEDGSLKAWGKENMWKLLPENLPSVEQMAVGSEHVLAFTRDRKLISWGWGKHGNCGDLTRLGNRAKNDMVNGFWNEILIPGAIKFVGAGFCTSFVLTEVLEENPS